MQKQNYQIFPLKGANVFIDNEVIKNKCRENFSACWDALIDAQDVANSELLIWLKENYEHLVHITRRGGQDEKVQTEFLWSLDEVGYSIVHFEDSLWKHPSMPISELEAEFENADDTQRLTSILQNPSCPKSLLLAMSEEEFEDRYWCEDVDEEDFEDLKQLAIDLFSLPVGLDKNMIDKQNQNDTDFLQDVIDIMEINGISFPKSNPDSE